MKDAEEFYIQWCLEQQPEYEDMIRDHAKGDGMQEIFSIMEQYKDHVLDELKQQLEQRKEDLDNKKESLELSGNPDDWILANGVEQVRMGVHSVISIVEENENE